MVAIVGRNACPSRTNPRNWEARQWTYLVKVAALKGVRPDRITAEQLESGRQELWEECRRQSRRVLGQIISMSLFEVAATRFHMGQIDVYPARVNLPARGRFEERWAAVAPRVAATFRNYLAQRAAVRRPSTINGERQ